MKKVVLFLFVVFPLFIQGSARKNTLVKQRSTGARDPNQDSLDDLHYREISKPDLLVNHDNLRCFMKRRENPPHLFSKAAAKPANRAKLAQPSEAMVKPVPNKPSTRSDASGIRASHKRPIWSPSSDFNLLSQAHLSTQNPSLTAPVKQDQKASAMDESDIPEKPRSSDMLLEQLPMIAALSKRNLAQVAPEFSTPTPMDESDGPTGASSPPTVTIAKRPPSDFGGYTYIPFMAISPSGQHGIQRIN